MFCFFFKQKTAYEMRISDWSSDVCSSDLSAAICSSSKRPNIALSGTKIVPMRSDATNCTHQGSELPSRQPMRSPGLTPMSVRCAASAADACSTSVQLRVSSSQCSAGRSEEHTSELQSLMRISYAVLCLKKKTNTTYNMITK